MPLIVEGTFGKIPLESIQELSSNDMALIALVTQSFMNIMFEEIRKAGFIGAEFLEKSELFLRAVTPSYPQKEFEILLDVFNQIDDKFSKTKFYYGLCTLRQICVNDKGDAKILLDEVGVTLSNYDHINSSLIIFTTHLIENIIKFIQSVRKLSGIENMSIDELRFHIDSRFQNCLMSTISEVKMTINKLKA